MLVLSACSLRSLDFARGVVEVRDRGVLVHEPPRLKHLAFFDVEADLEQPAQS